MASLREKDITDDDSFDGFDEDEALAENDSGTAAKLQATTLEDKDEEEEALERLVLGGRASFREALFRDDFTADEKALVAIGGRDEEAGPGLANLDDSALFFIDTAKGPLADNALAELGKTAKDQETNEDAPAWADSDDERLTVSLAGASQRRKFRIAEGEDVISGTEYASRLRQQYLQLYPLPAWAQQGGDRKRSKSRRRSSGSYSSDSDSEDADDEVFDSALPLERFLRDVNSFNGDGARKRRKLRPEAIDIQRSRDIPDAHKVAVSSLSFHPHFPIILSASTSSLIYLHHYAPTALPTPNPMLTSVQAKGTPVRHVEFLHPNGDAIVFAGRRRYFHSWNLNSGLVQKVSKIQGHQKEHKSMEEFRLSPCGRYMAIASTVRKGGGALNIVSISTMQWVSQAKIDGRGGIADFAWWRTGDGLTILGKDGRVTEWNMSKGRTVGTWQDAGSNDGTVLALGGSQGPSELGGDRWVAVGSTSGYLSVYDRRQLIARSEGDEVELKALPEPKRSLDQLTTPITVVTFSPDGQLMAFGSRLKQDAFRLVHLPSCTVYRNWPTQQTPLGRVTAVAFSTPGDVLAVGNDNGRIRVWEIRE